MRSKRTALSVFMAMIICLMTDSYLTYAQKGDKPEWIFLIADNHGWKNYYDSKSITHTPEGIVQVQAKQIPVYKDDEDKKARLQRLTENRKWLGIKTDGYDSYAYSVTILEINCATQEGRSGTIIDYDDSDKEIGKNVLKEVEWAPIAPRSWVIELVPKVCEQK